MENHGQVSLSRLFGRIEQQEIAANVGLHITTWKMSAEMFPEREYRSTCNHRWFDIGDLLPNMTSCSYVPFLATCHDVSHLCYWPSDGWIFEKVHTRHVFPEANILPGKLMVQLICYFLTYQYFNRKRKISRLSSQRWLRTYKNAR